MFLVFLAFLLCFEGPICADEVGSQFLGDKDQGSEIRCVLLRLVYYTYLVLNRQGKLSK